MGYNPGLLLLGLWFRLLPPGRWELPLAGPCAFSSHSSRSWGCFLTFWHHKNAPGSSWFFHAPALESALFPRSLGPFSSSRASSQPSDWICISCVSYIAGPFLTHWAIRETHSSMLVWEISWTEEPGRLHSMGLQRGGHDWATKH